jgi:hypothetical protein
VLLFVVVIVRAKGVLRRAFIGLGVIILLERLGIIGFLLGTNAFNLSNSIFFSSDDTSSPTYSSSSGLCIFCIICELDQTLLLTLSFNFLLLLLSLELASVGNSSIFFGTKWLLLATVK